MRPAILMLGVWCTAFGQSQAPTPRDRCVVELGRLIAYTEGWRGDRNLVRRQHNPGALRLRSGPYRWFATDADGWEALFRQIESFRARRFRWIRIIRIWSEVPDRYQAAIAPRFAACLAHEH